MKKVAAFLVLLGCISLNAQTYTENFTKTHTPKVAFSVSELRDAVEELYTLPRMLTLNAPVNSGTYEARESITLSDGFHATGDVSVRISSPESAAPHPDLLQNITYTDGLGRPIQSIAKGQSPQGYDMVSFMEYDPYGREAATYLPYPTTQNLGEIVADPLAAQKDYYSATYGDAHAKSERLFDDSPLNRVMETSSPGKDWRIIPNSDEDHTRKMDYATNTTSEGIYRFVIDESGSVPVVRVAGYASGELFKNTVKNENWKPSDGPLNTVVRYTDKRGQTIAEVVFEAVAGETKKRITQNVYDRHRRLRYILPPKAVEKADPQQNAYTIDENLVYQYQYDVYNRQIAQRVPSRDWEYVVYDPLDRPILTQDAKLAANNQWLFTKYDAFGRSVYSGLYTSTKSRSELQAEADNYIGDNTDNKANTEQRTPRTTTVGGIALNYTNTAFPVNGISEVLSIHYYDDYTFTDADKPTTPNKVQGQTVTVRTQGLQTANFTKTLGHSTWNKLYTYYDEKSREIKIHQKNHLGGYTSTESQLDFRGKTEFTLTQHKRTSNATQLTIRDRFTYDHAERPLGHFQKINSQAEERIAENEYDALGMLIKKRVGNTTGRTPLQIVDYTYTIRGWLKQINNPDDRNNDETSPIHIPIYTTYIDEDGTIVCAAPQSIPLEGDFESVGTDLFALTINYNTTAEGASAAPARYDGNISQTIWKSAHDNTQRSYAYQYDPLNRLSASYYQFNNTLNGNTTSHFNTQYTYDAQGNLATLVRNGTGVVLDQLTYNYGTGGNQLRSVSDAGTSAGFVDGNTSGDDYAYDSNGNMIKDLNKGITHITYNYLDLVEAVSLPNNRSVTFQYDASGMKLQKQYKNGSIPLSTVEYLGGFQYTNGALQFFPTAEGYVYRSGNTYKYMYLYTDHLGNTRLSYTDSDGDGVIASSEIASNTDYYPFGMVHSGQYLDGLASGYKYNFQGKEYQDESGLNWHDFGSRMYDPALGRWMATDPQNQFASPYLALGNNPLLYIDPNGEWALIDDAIAFVVGGAINLTVNAFQGNLSGDNIWESIGKGVAAFAAGGTSGTLALYGPAGWAAGGAILGGTNAWLGGATGWDIASGAGLGIVTSVAGGAIGQGLAPAISGLTNNISSPVLQGVVGGTVGGAVTGGVLTELTGGDFLDGAWQGAVTGGIAGGVAAGARAKSLGLNPFTGKRITPNSPEAPVTQLKKSDLSSGSLKNRQIRGDIFDVDFNQALNEWNNVRQQYGLDPVTADQAYGGRSGFGPITLPDQSRASGQFYYGGNTNPNGWNIKIQMTPPPNQPRIPPVHLRYRNILKQ